MRIDIHLWQWYLKLRKDSDHVGNYRTEFARTYSFLCFTLYVMKNE